MPRFAAACALIAVGCSGTEERFRPLAVGDVAPAYSTYTLDGDTIRVGAGQPPQLTLLNVWATWCVPCQQEFPDLQRIHADYGPRGLRVIGVSIDAERNAEDIAEFARRYSAEFTIAHDIHDRVRGLYRSIGVPETYLISPDGKLLMRHAGAFPEGAAAVRRAIDSALAN
jgi:thiol-disulfide isomerase/thioredoxin